MATVISLRIFLLCNSILLYFVPKKLISLLSSSSWFSTLPDTKTAPQPPVPSSAAQTSIELKRVFEMFDRNGDGRISQEELSESLGNLGISIPEEELSAMIQKIDANNDGIKRDGSVDMGEFEDLYRSIMGERDEDEDMKEVFSVFDQNGDGYITSTELNSVLESLKQGKTIEDCKVMIRKVDVDGDGRIDYKEFMHMMRGGGFMAASGS